MMEGVPPQVINTQPLPFDDFSGGMTDYYVGGPLNKYQKAENFLIFKHGKQGHLLTRPGSEILDSTYYQIPAGAQRIGTLKYFDSTLFYHSARKLYYVDSGWTTLQGPSGNDLFPSGIDTTTVVSTSTWNHHLFLTSSDLTQRVQKAYKNGSNVWQLRTAGMPLLASSPTVTAGGAGAGTYLYRFLYYYEYVVGTVTFIDRGPTVEVTLASAAAPNVSTVAITSIPALANSTTHNYDTASSNLKVEIYRTTNGGINFYKVGSVNNGTTTYNDNTSDTTLQTNEPLYTEGGFPERDPPPLCKFIHIVDDRGFYAHIKDGSEVLSNELRQSIPGDIDAVPEDFSLRLQDEITGISSAKSYPIALCNFYIYRIDGAFDEAGRGFLSAQRISDTAGCVSNLSIVQTQDGIFWAGTDGFYFSDGFQCFRISEDLNETYPSFVSSAQRKRRIYGAYDTKRKRIYWSVMYDGSATDNDAIFVADLNWGISTNVPFTFHSGGTNFAPTAIEFIDGNLIRADSRGYTFRHRDSLYVDPKVDTGTAPTNWKSATILYDFKSVATDFGTIQQRKWVPSIVVNCKDDTNLSLQITSINDDGRSSRDLLPIRFRNKVVWGDADIIWGDPDIIWNYQGIVDERRRFPARSLRCEYKQVQFTNAHVAIVNSELLGTCSVNVGTHQATLTNSTDFDWPDQSVDYYLSFSQDNYTREFLVTGRTADVLTFSDSGSLAPSGTQDWVLRGKIKGEVLNLISFTVNYAVFGETQKDFRSSGTGEVGVS